MKILLLSQYWYPENGVPQRRWSWLSKILVDAGHDVTVIAPPPHYQRKIELRQWWKDRGFRSGVEPVCGPSGERIVRSGFFPGGASLTQRAINQATVALGTLWILLKAPGKLKSYRPDLVIGTVPALPTAVVTALAGRRFNVPYIIDLRDAWPDLLRESGQWNKGTGKTSRREKLLRRGPLQLVSMLTDRSVNWSLKHAAGISVTSSYLAENLKERPVLQKNGRTPPITTIRNVFPPETNYRATAKVEGPIDSLNVLYAGTLGRAQNLANAIKAAGLAKDQGVDVKLRLVGAGVARPALQKMADKTPVEVAFEQRHPATDLADFYEWADTALVHLTDWEPLERAVPSKTYELMSTGLHISAVVCGETAELVRKRRSGDVVAPERPEELADLWVNLAADRDRLITAGEGGEWVERERRDIAPSRLLTLIEEVIR